ncbi:MAG TPA: SH3 domain-containing protein, partial [Chloroflexota bacterium]|nr:SH3 domain-containing protein [Chloroflexota bacterium]
MMAASVKRVCVPLLVLLLTLLTGATAMADRFGPPWMGRVGAPQAVVRNDAQPDASVVGAVPSGAIVVVLEQRDEWTRIPDGWVSSADLAEATEPWMAQVNAPTSVYALPNGASGIRRGVRGSDVLLVTGVAHGVDGDENVWW